MERIKIEAAAEICDSNIITLSYVAHYKNFKSQKKDVKMIALFSHQDLQSYDFNEKVKQFIDTLVSKGVKPTDIIISVDAYEKSKLFKKEDWQKLIELQEKYKKHGITFGVEDMSRTWSLEEVANANNSITEIAHKKIRKNEFSPLEKLLCAYINVKNHEYKSEGENEHYSQSRSIYGVLNSDKIVCVGYSELLKAIIEQVGDENIKVFNF